jgi:hypothetical protein
MYTIFPEDVNNIYTPTWLSSLYKFLSGGSVKNGMKLAE